MLARITMTVNPKSGQKFENYKKKSLLRDRYCGKCGTDYLDKLSTNCRSKRSKSTLTDILYYINSKTTSHLRAETYEARVAVWDYCL
jgi:hypothetical protein